MFRFLLAHVSMLAPVAAEFISAMDDTIRYVGRIGTDADARTFSWPGSQAITIFTGTSVSARIGNDGSDFFHAFIDGDFTKSVVIECKKGIVDYPIASGLSSGEHTVQLYKRTETGEGNARFLGFEVDGARGRAPPAPARRIEFYGDSITSGMGVLDESRNDNNNVRLKDHFMSYAAMTARNFAADHHSISVSGIGVVANYAGWNDGQMRFYWNRFNGTAAQGPSNTWNFTQWIPQLVVINLFQNDCWIVPGIHPPVSSTTIVNGYKSLVTSIRAQYPTAHIVGALGNMDATSGNTWPGYITTAMAQLTSAGDSRLHTLFFPYKNTGGHPVVKEQTAMADQLTTFIRDNNLL